MGPSDARVLSRPYPVHFAGFSTTTTRLQQAGWSLSVEQDIMSRRIRLAMRFEPCQLYMVSEASDFDYFRAADRYGDDQRLEFHVRHCASRFVVQMHETTFAFQPIDATPQFISSTRKDIEDFGIFATPLARTEEIIVEPASVQELLEKIKSMQAPELAAIRKRRQSYEGSTTPAMQRQQFHAQILSIAA